MKTPYLKLVLILSVIANCFLILLLGGYFFEKIAMREYLKKVFRFKEELSKHEVTDPYYNTRLRQFEQMPNTPNEIIFLGNSITDFGEWSELFRNVNVKNRGINGDTIEGLIHRLDEVLESKPQKIFLMIGINDWGIYQDKEKILSQYSKLIDLIHEASPKTKIYLQSILPTFSHQVLDNDDIITLNKGIRSIAKQNNLTYINLFDSFFNGTHLIMDYSLDGLHLNGKGYILWRDLVKKYVEE